MALSFCPPPLLEIFPNLQETVQRKYAPREDQQCKMCVLTEHTVYFNYILGNSLIPVTYEYL